MVCEAYLNDRGQVFDAPFSSLFIGMVCEAVMGG